MQYMAISKFHEYIMFIILVLIATLTTCLEGAINGKTSPFFLFGDSLFDVGNNNYINTTTLVQSNFPPYGETFFNYPTGRASNGRTIPDFIAEYAKLPRIQPYLQPQNNDFSYGTDFASAGAGALPETFPGLVINLKTQFSNFNSVKTQLEKKLGDKEAKKLVSDAVYLFSIGGNDYIYRIVFNTSSFRSYSSDEYVNMVMSNITSVIRGIHEKGGRKFGFVNLLPLGCLPFAIEITQGNTCNEELTGLVKLHNEGLKENLEKLERELKGFKYSYFDTNTAMTQRMENPSKYGFKDGEKACCGSGKFNGVNSCGGMRGIKEYELCDNPNEYLFFDYSHPSQPAHQQLASLLWSGSPTSSTTSTTTTSPNYNLNQLFRL